MPLRSENVCLSATYEQTISAPADLVRFVPNRTCVKPAT
jgi:hypothetical protein